MPSSNPVSVGTVHCKTTTGPILDPDLSAQAFGNQPTFPCRPKNQEKTETSVPISFKCSELLKISLVGLVVNRHLALFSSSAGDHGSWVQSPLERDDFFPWKIHSIDRVQMNYIYSFMFFFTICVQVN